MEKKISCLALLRTTILQMCSMSTIENRIKILTIQLALVDMTSLPKALQHTYKRLEQEVKLLSMNVQKNFIFRGTRGYDSLDEQYDTVMVYVFELYDELLRWLTLEHHFTSYGNF